ncbi:MAG: hypothetical protein P8130_03975 [Deltaproteobacteria bacterium]
MDAVRIRDEKELKSLLEEMQSFSTAAQLSRLSQMRQGLELDEMYYEQKGNEAGLVRTGKCLALIDARLAELKAND